MLSTAAVMVVGVDVCVYIQSYNQHNAYIATQGPLPNTVNDLWRMLLEFNSKIVVTLCHITEESEEVCHPFWPSQKNDTLHFGGIAVTLLSTTNYENFDVHKLQIHNDKVRVTLGNINMHNIV